MKGKVCDVNRINIIATTIRVSLCVSLYLVQAFEWAIVLALKAQQWLYLSRGPTQKEYPYSEKHVPNWPWLVAVCKVKRGNKRTRKWENESGTGWSYQIFGRGIEVQEGGTVVLSSMGRLCQIVPSMILRWKFYRGLWSFRDVFGLGIMFGL